MRYKTLNVGFITTHIIMALFYYTMYHSAQHGLRWAVSGLLCHTPCRTTWHLALIWASGFRMGILSITLSDRPGNVIKLHKQDSYQEETFHAKRDQRKTLSIKKISTMISSLSRASSMDAWKISGSLMIWTRKGFIHLEGRAEIQPRVLWSGAAKE